jgi:RNA polymerase sigma factor (sigma-70 family)
MDGFLTPAPSRQDLAQAIEALFQRYDGWFRRVLRKRYGDLADDLAHEAYLRTAAHDAQGRVDHHRSYLLRVADNLARDRYRRRQREDDHAAHSEAFALQSTAATQEFDLTLKQIVLALPPELRDVFVLSHFHGLTYDEIALQLGVKKRTAKDRMRQAWIRVSAAMRD